MKIICAGFPKTGTKSMALALRELGYVVHDFEEHVDLHLDDYLDFFEGKIEAAKLMEKYKDVDAVVDQPAALIWRIFHEHYPEAKVILMERSSPEVWFQSCMRMMNYYRTMFCTWYDKYLPFFSPTRAKLELFYRHNIGRATSYLGNIWDVNPQVSEECWKNQYMLHNAAVKHIVPPEQLLVIQVGEGWERLCKFLDKQIPDKPFPKENVTGSKGNIVDKVMEMDKVKQIMVELGQNLLLLLTSLTSLVALLAFIIST